MGTVISTRSYHFGHKVSVDKSQLYEGWNQLDLFSEERNKEVEINIKYVQWKSKRKRNASTQQRP